MNAERLLNSEPRLGARRRAGAGAGVRPAGTVLAGIPAQLVLICWALIVCVPMLWSFVSSFKSDREIFESPWALPKVWHWENFVRAWRESHVGEYFLNTTIVVVIGLVLCLALSSVVAYVLAQFRFPGRTVLYYVFVGGMAFPGFLALVPLFFVVKNLGLLNSYAGLIIVYATQSLSFSVFFLTSFFRALPMELAEAALIDGCGHWRVFWTVMLPLARPGLISIGIFDFLGMWNQYVLPIVLVTDPSKYVIGQGLANLAVNQGYASDFSGMFAGLTIATVPVFAIYLIFQRKITAGMTVGALR